ncbi:hypothetical protein BGZ58_011258 [Dissophora ornata]|nr:hypothetical protein BGZ58_011258 [Dissophora ornata]
MTAQLSNRDDYSYFFRTIPTELMFGNVMMDFVVSRGWKTIAVYYTGDSLGSEMMDNIASEAAKRNITIGYRRAFWEMGTSSDVGPALDTLEDSGQRIVVVAAVNVPLLRLMIEAVNRGLVSKDYVWLIANQITEPLLSGNTAIKLTDLNGLFMFDNLLRLHGYPPYEMFLDKWSALDPSHQAYSCMMVMANAFANAVKGNWTALHLLAAGKLGPALKPVDMNVNYTGPGGPMVFDMNGDVVYGNFILYNFQSGNIVPIGTSYSGVFNLSSPPMYFDGTYNTPADSAPLQILNPKLGSPIGLVVISVAGLSILFSLLTMLIVVVYRRAQVIKASRPLTLNVGFVLVVSNIVAKNFRVYKIFHNIYVTKRVIKDAHLLKIVGTIMLGNLIIMAVWFLKTPPTLEQITMPDFTAYWACNNVSGSIAPIFIIAFVYNAALLLIATYLAYMNRNVAANYNECRQIAFVVYNILLSGCLAMPTVFLPRDQFLTKFFLSTVVILFGTTFSLMFLFLPKLWELFTQIERSQQRANGPGDGADESSMDEFIYSGAPGWMNSSGDLVILGQGVVGTTDVGPGDSANGSSHHLSSGRKGSVTTLDEAKDETLKEAHVGYMSVKFLNRFLPFLSSWRMRRVVLYPKGRYFTCFELGKPETGRTYTFVSVFIHSRESGTYILRVVGCSRYDFLLQVQDEKRLLYWYSLFDNHKQQADHVHSGSTGTGSIVPLGNLSLTNLSVMEATPSPSPMNSSSFTPGEGVGGGSSPGQRQHNESDRTLGLSMNNWQVSGDTHIVGPGEKRSGNGVTPDAQAGSAAYDEDHRRRHETSSSTMTLTASPKSMVDSMNEGERARTLVEDPCHLEYVGR